MGLDLNAPNFAGTAAMASGGAGNLNLQAPGALGLQALQIRKQEEDAKRRAAIERMALSQQGALALGNQDIARQGLVLQQEQQQGNQDIARQGLLQDGNQFDARMGMEQAKLGFDQEQLAAQNQLGADQISQRDREALMQAQQKEMARLVDMNKEDLKERGRFASFGLVAFNKAKTPEEKQQVRTMFLEEAGQKKYLSKEELALASKMPLSQFGDAMGMKMMQYGSATEFKALSDANEEKSSGGTYVELPDGTKIRSEPTKANTTALQKTVMDKEKGLQQLGKMREGYKENYFTAGGQTKNYLSSTAEWLSDVPGAAQATEALAGAATGKTKEERSDMLRNTTAYLNNVEQFFFDYQHEITGAAAAKEEIDRLRGAMANKSLSPSQFLGALDQVVAKYAGEAEFKKNVLREGLDVSKKDGDPNDALRQFLKGKNKYSESEIEAFIKGKK